jgi:streptogramin lyase
MEGLSGRVMPRILSLMIACLVLNGMTCSTGASAAPVGLIKQFKVGAFPTNLLAGPGGDIWFTFSKETRRGEIGGIARITPVGRITKFNIGVIGPNNNGGAELKGLTLGPEGNLWFTHSGTGPAIGRITPQGKITTFTAGLDAQSDPGALVLGPEGDLWFSDSRLPPAIGRVTPEGSVSEFSAGLSPESAPRNLLLGPDGNFWFGNISTTGITSTPSIGRITPSGQITEFGGLSQSLVPGGYEPAVGPDGNLWFSAGGSQLSVGRITPLGAITLFSAGLNAKNFEAGPFLAGPDGNVWFAVRGNGHLTNPVPGFTTAIGRITPQGSISEFGECVHPGPPYTGPNSLAVGPEGDIWYASSSRLSLPEVGTPPAIGRVTPSGKITEFQQGLGAAGEPDQIVTGADGAMWFTDQESIGRIRPTDAPPNTFIIGRSKPVGVGQPSTIPVSVPGPGSLRFEAISIVTGRGQTRLPRSKPVITRAAGCGPTIIEVRRTGLTKSSFDRLGEVNLKVSITFTPTGGSSYSRIKTIRLVKRRGR